MAERFGDEAEDLEIVAKVVANLAGLGKAMQRDGCIENPSALKDFTLGFTQAKATFDYIDVGYGKERADSKIKGMVKKKWAEQRRLISTEVVGGTNFVLCELRNN